MGFLLDLGTAGQHILETLVHHIRHRDEPTTADGLGFLHIVFAATLTDKLMIHTDLPILKVQVLFREAAELADTHARFQQYHELVVILGVGLVGTDKGHPCVKLLLRQGKPLFRIIGHHIGQLEDERVLANRILVAGHLEGRFNNTRTLVMVL